MFRFTFCAYFLITPAISLASVNWIGGSTSNWHDPANWSGSAVPSPNDDVVILNSSAGSVVNLSAPVDVNSLLVGGGILVNNNGHQLVVDDGATSTLLNGDAVLNISNGANPLDYATSQFFLTSGSSMSQLGADVIVSDPGSVMNSGTTFAGFGDVIFPGVQTSPQTWLTNSGTIRPLLGELIIAAIDTSNGHLDLDGPNSNGILDVDDDGFLFEGGVRLTVAGQVEPFSGTLLIGQDDEASFSDELQLGVSGGLGATLTMEGRQGSASLLGDIRIQSSGTQVNVQSGTANFFGHVKFDNGVMQLSPNTTTTFDKINFNQSSFTHVQQGAVLEINGNSRVEAGAAIGGQGVVVNNGLMAIVGDVNVAGRIVSPGDFSLTVGTDASTIHVGDFEQGPDSTLWVRLVDTNDFSQIFVIHDAASLDGDLALATNSGFSANLGDSFPIITSQVGITGTFDDVLQNFAAPGPGLEWFVDYGTNVVSLVAVALATAGDFNADGLWNCSDVDQLVTAVAANEFHQALDLNGDETLNIRDVHDWLVIAGRQNLASMAPYLVGDANLDGLVDGFDFLLWNASKFKPNIGWCGGDFSADGRIDGRDFMLWSRNKFTSSDDVRAIPEATTGGMILFAAALATVFTNRRWK